MRCHNRCDEKASRHDDGGWERETNTAVTSDAPAVWNDPVPIQRPGQPWDLVQVGNCGGGSDPDWPDQPADLWRGLGV
jgi:hypothetical protein